MDIGSTLLQGRIDHISSHFLKTTKLNINWRWANLRLIVNAPKPVPWQVSGHFAWPVIVLNFNFLDFIVHGTIMSEVGKLYNCTRYRRWSVYVYYLVYILYKEFNDLNSPSLISFQLIENSDNFVVSNLWVSLLCDLKQLNMRLNKFEKELKSS